MEFLARGRETYSCGKKMIPTRKWGPTASNSASNLLGCADCVGDLLHHALGTWIFETQLGGTGTALNRHSNVPVDPHVTSHQGLKRVPETLATVFDRFFRRAVCCSIDFVSESDCSLL